MQVFGCFMVLFCFWDHCSARPNNGVALLQTNDNKIICSKWPSVHNTTKYIILVKGEHVLFSDLVDMTGNVNNFCDIPKATNKTDIVLIILSTNTFVIDDDFDGGNSNMVIIAPTWLVLGDRKISLNGERLMITESDLLKRHKYYLCENYFGEDGIPGRDSYMKGGTFLGVGQTFINGKSLTLTVNGGEGSPGSGGGNGGEKSKDRRFWDFNLSVDNLDCKTAGVCYNNGSLLVKKYQCERFKGLDIRYDELWLPCSGNKTVELKTSRVNCRVEIQGYSECNGGGRGGLGGNGGGPGYLELIDLSGAGGVTLENRQGKRWGRGKDGLPGKGGHLGDTLVYSITEEKGKVVKSVREVIYKSLMKLSSNQTENEEYPDDLEYDRKDLWFGPAHLYRILNEYRRFTRESFYQSDLTDFYFQMDINMYRRVCSMYNVYDLLDILRELEEDYHKFSKTKGFPSLYESLLVKIRGLMEPPCSAVPTTEIESLTQRQNDKVKPQSMSLLRYLYTATMGRLYNLRERIDTVLVIDIAEYLNSVQEIVLELKEVKGEHDKFLMVISKLNTIQEYKADFGKYIAAKCKEANDLITEKILPEIDRVNTRTTHTIEKFIDEINNIKKAREANLEKLKEKEAKLKETMIVNALFGCFKIFASALSMIPGPASVVGMVMSTTVDVAQGIYDFVETSEFPDVESFYNNSMEVQEAFCFYQHNKTNNNNNNNRTIITRKICGEKPKKKKLKKMGKKQAKKLAKSKKKFGIGLGGVVAKLQEDTSKLQEVENQIEKEKENIERIKEFEKSVRETMKPQMEMMGESMKSVASSLKDNSPASLDVTKWQIEATLNDIMRKMDKTMKGFEVKDEMKSCLEDMKTTMETLTKLFNHIQHEQEQLRLGNLIADIGAASVTDVNITNPNDRNITHHLQLMIASNLVLQKYQEAVNAFKQFVFPFAHLYFAGLTLPTSVTVGDSLEDLVEAASTQVNSLVKRLNDYKRTIKKHDSIIGVGTFSSNYESVRPFYVWRNAEHRDTITKLLSCQEVIFNADINYSPKNKDAIKFNAIEFSFKASKEHKQLQAKIENVLKKFEVMATHMGSSYYRFQNKTYMIMTNSVHFWYNIEKRKDGTPVSRDVSYDKMSHGDYSLSPYAVWKVQLGDLTDDVTCDDLKYYADKVDVELVGEGHYVRAAESHTIQLQVETYYKSLETDQPSGVVTDEPSVVNLWLKASEQRRSARNKTRIEYNAKKVEEETKYKKLVDKYRDSYSLESQYCGARLV